MKKILSVAFSIVMILMLLPCSAAAEQTAEEPSAGAAAGDRIILTIGDMSTRSGNRYNEEKGMWRYLAERLGVDIRYAYIPPEEFSSRLASGDLPDIVATDKNLSTILEYGVALDAEPYLEKYCPNFLKGDARFTYDVFKQLGNGEDGFYFFPAKIGYNGVGYDNETTARGYVVRWDYYKELGYPPINNEDDFLSVLLQMHKRHPFTEEGYPTYLYGTDNFSGYDTAFRAEQSVDYWAMYKYQNNIFTNEVFDGYSDPAHSMWWASMEWENKLYRAGKADGSYDMELFTQTIEQFDAKVLRGQYLGLHATKGGLYKKKLKTDPDTLTGYNSVPTSATNFYTNVYQLLGNGPGYMWFISANSRHKEEALGLFNLMFDPEFVRELTLGRRGETWDYDADGVPRMNEYGQAQLDAYKAGSTDPDNYYVNWGSFDKMSSNWPCLRDNSLHPDGFPVDFARIERNAGEILKKTNDLLCVNNQAEMFVTVWICILEISTGRMKAANAGHEYPAIRKEKGIFELYKDVHGFVIGGMEGISYKEYVLELNPGDKLFVYTDGVTEATAARGEMFGAKRMIEVLNDCADGNPWEILQSVGRAVDDFVGDAEQFDDLTMMCLEYKGPANSGHS